MENIIIRPANIEDRDPLKDMYIHMYDILSSFGMPYRLNEEIIDDVLSLILKARTNKIFLAEMEGKLIGFVVVDIARLDRKLSYKPNNIMANIKDIYVIPSLGRTGVGQRLLNTAENWAFENGASIIECNVLNNNEPALKFWNNNEYEIMGKILYKILK